MVNKKDTFSALSIKDRAELINIYVKGGMMDLKEIKDHYNSLYEEKEPNKYGWGGASKEALGKAFGDASSTVGSVGNIAGNVMTIVSNGIENAEINTTEADNAIEAVKSYKLDNSSLDALANSYNSTPWAATDYDSSDFTKSGWEIAGNTFESTLSGITTGASVGGPWGAVIGGLAGLGSGLIGWGIGESKAEEAERRLEAEAKKANRAIELNAVNTRDSILQQQTNNTLRNIAADGGELNSLDSGGAIENEQENSGYATTTKQDLEDVETFNSNWYKYRDAQLANAIKDTYDARYTEGLNFLQREFPNWTDQTKVANAARNFINKRLDTVTEFDSREALKDLETRNWLEDEYYYIFPDRKPNPELIGPPKPVSDSDLKFITEFLYKGVYNPKTHSIVYDKDYKNSSTKVHERAHASVPMIRGWSRSPLLDPVLNVQFKDGVEADPAYYDSVDEIYSRLMQLRFVNGLDPTHTYTLDEVKAMRNDSKFIDYDIFDRYTDESILMLLNEVAHNTTDSNRLDYVNPENIAANGGKLNLFDAGGNTKQKYSLDETTDNGEKYIDIVSEREQEAYNALLRNGYSYEEAKRLSPILTTQSIYETGWRRKAKGNNYAGYLNNGKKIVYESPEKFWDDHIKNLSNRWPNWSGAKSVEEYYDIVNQTSLGLKTKKEYNEYKKKHPNTFIYSPEWENKEYKKRLLNTFNRTNYYLNAISPYKDFPIEQPKPEWIKYGEELFNNALIKNN